jgi:hypothetical protein
MRRNLEPGFEGDLWRTRIADSAFNMLPINATATVLQPSKGNSQTVVCPGNPRCMPREPHRELIQAGSQL